MWASVTRLPSKFRGILKAILCPRWEIPGSDVTQLLTTQHGQQQWGFHLKCNQTGSCYMTSSHGKNDVVWSIDDGSECARERCCLSRVVLKESHFCEKTGTTPTRQKKVKHEITRKAKEKPPLEALVTTATKLGSSMSEEVFLGRYLRGNSSNTNWNTCARNYGTTSQDVPCIPQHVVGQRRRSIHPLAAPQSKRPGPAARKHRPHLKSQACTSQASTTRRARPR